MTRRIARAEAAMSTPDTTNPSAAGGHGSGFPDAARIPKPRAALRVGLTGHRPGRLREASLAAEEISGLPFSRYDEKLRERLVETLLGIERGVFAARRGHVYERQGSHESFFSDAVPQIRLVCGMALGCDMLGMEVVDGVFRGGRAASLAGTDVPTRAADSVAEWRIDAVLPCLLPTFAMAAAGDFAEGAKRGEATPRLFIEHWARASGLPDTILALPARWRETAAAKPSEVERTLTSYDCLAGLQERLGLSGTALERPPAAREGRAFQLDHTPAGDFLLRQIDVLIAIWDGKPSRGPGGTPDIVRLAVGMGLPVVLIDAADPLQPPRMVLSVEIDSPDDAVSGWHEQAVRPIVESADASVDAIQSAVVRVLSPPPAGAAAGRDGARAHSVDLDERGRLTAFFDEVMPKHGGPPTYQSFQRVMTGGVTTAIRHTPGLFLPVEKPLNPNIRSESLAAWRGFIDDNPDEGQLGVLLEEVLHPRFLAVDLLAARYASLYRDVFIRSYLLSALAVLIALSGFLLPASGETALPVKAMLVAVELFILVWIARLVRRGRRERWHQKFVQYRALAESLRHLRFLATFAEYAEAGRAAEQSGVWWLWYLRATARELGLPSGALDAAYQRSLLAAVARHEVEGQIDYHEKTARSERATHAAVHHLGDALFLNTMKMLAFVLVVYVFLVLLVSGDIADRMASGVGMLKSMKLALDAKGVYWALDASKPWIGVVAAFAPTLGAALAGIRFTADFEGRAARSDGMRATLAMLREDLAEAAFAQDFNGTRAILQRTAAVLAEDVSAFNTLFGRRQLTLPG
jgi:hypothetical protein